MTAAEQFLQLFQLHQEDHAPDVRLARHAEDEFNLCVDGASLTVNPKPNIIMAGKAGPRIPSNKKACTRDGSFGLLDEIEALVEDCERADVEVVDT